MGIPRTPVRDGPAGTQDSIQELDPWDLLVFFEPGRSGRCDDAGLREDLEHWRP